MKGLFSIVIAVVALVTSGVIGAGTHDAVFKSISSSEGECGQYLNNDGTGECNVHCVGVVHHVWNDTVAQFTANYASFFVPDPEDKCNQNRTNRCLEQVYSSVPVYDKCLRAQQAGQCFIDQYGQLDTGLLQYVAMTDLQYTRVVLQCAAMLGLSNDQLKAMAEQGAYNVSESACLLRCALIRMGLWSDEKGVDLSRATAQCGPYGDSAVAQECQAKVLAEECDKCVQVKRIAQECLNMHFVIKQLGDSEFAVELYGGYYCYYYYSYYPCIALSYYSSSGSDAYAGSSSYNYNSLSLLTS